MDIERTSGILLHPTSLPNGVLDDHAYRFVDWLAAAGQSWWQVLPLGPPEGLTGSPYMSPSAFAGSPALVADPDAPVAKQEADAFRERHAYWIDDWVAHGGALDDQVRFEREWQALRAYAAERGVRIFGDMPIYVADGSADHIAHPKLFQNGAVAGVPPDSFAKTGQLWGNPLYDWSAMRADGYRWWIERFRRAFDLVDLTRLDHFRGFVAYWAVPVGNSTAVKGKWRRGPGADLFHAVERELGPLPVVAEDLGVITEPVVRMRRELGYPGMAVLQFGVGRDPANPHLPANHEEHSVAYTGTHDNDTIRGWWESASDVLRGRAAAAIREAGVEEPEPWWSMNRLALSSRCSLAVLQAQDVIGLGGEARMNVPGREGGNWSWQLEPGQLDAGLARRLRKATEAAGR
jgi:4-alpha-glucanotransferase